MGRPRTIVVDHDALLDGIRIWTDAETSRLSAAAETSLLSQFDLDDLQAKGVRINFPAFVGYELSPSERIRHQQALRRLGAAGLVTIWGERAARVKLTEAGNAHLQTLQAANAPAVGVCSLGRMDCPPHSSGSLSTATEHPGEGPRVSFSVCDSTAVLSTAGATVQGGPEP